MMRSLATFVEGGHVVVLGAPGVGKSHTLVQFAQQLLEAERKCVFVPIDNLIVSTEEDLKSELGFKSADFVGFLTSQALGKGEKGILIFDAFDAARSEQARRVYLRVIRQVIRELGESWTVVVSARLYDAKKCMDLIDLFSKQENEEGDTFTVPSGDVNCRHFFIPELTVDEIQKADVPGLWNLYEHSSPGLQTLLRIPFNIWLIERIASSSHDISGLSNVQSEVELLDVYWTRRVEASSRNENLRLLLLKATRLMVGTRSLAIRREEVYDPKLTDAWQELMSLEILQDVPPEGQRVAFRHNILFDYAVSVLLIEDTPGDFERFIGADPSRPLFLRRSLDYFFTRLWYAKPESFWTILWHILPNAAVQIRLFARLLPMAVVANELKHAEELQPLFDHCGVDRELGDEAILRLLQALRALNIQRDEVWCPILHHLSRNLSQSFVADLVTYLSTVFDRAKKSEDPALVAACGSTARKVLEWVWRQRGTVEGKRFDRLGSGWVLPIIAQSFSSAPQESRRILEPILAIVKENGFPIDFLYRLTHDLKFIVSSDPEFVGMVYRAVFENPETSDEKTEMGTPILPMSSTRRQDYQMCHYNLKEQYLAFIEAAPEVAIETAIHCLGAFILGAHVVPHLNEGAKLSDLIQEFPFRGKQACIMADLSWIWGESHYPDEPMAIASTLFEFLEKAGQDPGSVAFIESALDIFRDNAMVGYFWAGLLDLGARAPDRFATPLFELCTAFPIQTGNDTIHELAGFVEAAVPHFDSDMLREMEESLIALPAKADEHNTRALLESRRNLLLARIPRGQLQTDEARAVMAELEAAGRVPGNEPLVKFTTESRPYSEAEWLEDQGANLEKEENATLHAFFAPLDGFVSEWRNKRPTKEAAKGIAPTLQGAFALLHEDHGADKPVENSLWTKIGECAETMAKATEDEGSEEFRLCRRVLLECSGHPEPKPDPKYDDKFEHAGWSPAPRNEAAQGLPWIAVWTGGDTEVALAIEALVSDPKPSVRYLVTSDLFRLRRHYEDLFWRLVDRVAEQETNRVVQQALCRTLTYVVARDEEKTCRILDKLKVATLQAGEEAELLGTYVNMVMWLSIVRRNEWARATADEFLANPYRHSKALHRSTLDALSYVTPAFLTGEEKRVHAEQAREWLGRAIDAAALELQRIQSLAPEEITEDIQSVAHNVYRVIDEVVMRFYFSSGLFKGSRDGEPVTSEERGVFYRFIKPLLEQVIRVSDGEGGGVFFARTAHHFMELLNGVLEYDPRGVLHMAHRLAAISQAGRYHFDSMAVNEVVKLVESTLANHRAEVGDGECLDDLLGLLDIFAAVGWPEALRLVWRLDEVFR
ncbi:MAG TPA: ATP-binding protein [Candidatus Krumholzibacteria bacterium]|nr:ATP-binding protein [Candidatus Krumholzibacteria bacterium]HPD72381.1 ATP-binding protein [Candidatus Krumholzibacteria bacterium]HRY40687.1 ATP-binding protein [Candidatus Krumholzibacteria bacterium]